MRVGFSIKDGMYCAWSTLVLDSNLECYVANLKGSGKKLWLIFD